MELHTYVISSVITEPHFCDLKRKFEGVANWHAVCPYLMDDDDGHKTAQIRSSNNNVEGMRTEMLIAFLNEIPNPTWRNVVEALRAAHYERLADKIEHDLQG